jgi:hypothetical protein
MIYAYRLKDQDPKEKGRVVEGFTVRYTWQFTSDPKAVSLKNWGKVSVLEAKDVLSLKKAVETYDREQKDTASKSRIETSASQSAVFGDAVSDSGVPLAKDLEGKSLGELKDFAKAHDFDEAEYSKLTKSNLIEYIILGMRNKENG